MDRLKELSSWIDERQKNLEGKKDLNLRTMYDSLAMCEVHIEDGKSFEEIFEHFTNLRAEFKGKLPIGENAAKMVCDKMWHINQKYQKLQKQPQTW